MNGANGISNAIIDTHIQGALSLQEAVSEAHKASNHVIALEENSAALQFSVARMNLQFDLDYARANAAYKQLSNQWPKLAWPHYFLGQRQPGCCTVVGSHSRRSSV